MKNPLLAIALASTLYACTEAPDPPPTNTDQLDEILRQQRSMNAQVEHTERVRRSEELHQQFYGK